MNLIKRFEAEVATVTTESWWNELTPFAQKVFTYMGIATEAGEVQDCLKQAMAEGVPVDKKHLTEELGDVLWHIAMIGYAEDISMEEMMETSLDKFRRKYPQRFKFYDEAVSKLTNAIETDVVEEAANSEER